MKKLFTFLTTILIITTVWAQSPEKMSYQAVVRNSENQLLTNSQVGMQISILQGASDGVAVYVETQSPTTNANGLISIEIGNGTAITGELATIDWADGPYFIKTETDPSGGTNYTITGTSQLLSVPYALHAKTAESVSGGITETDPVFMGWNRSTGIRISENQITNLGNYIETETDPVYSNSIASGITATDTTSWNHKLDSYTETDPVYSNSIASGITATDTISWNHKLDSYTETDPVYSNSIASGITATDTTSWNHKLDSYTETDPVYSNSIASGITATDTTSWNHKLDSYTETDPVYSNSIASGITATDTTSWNHKLDSYTETDPVYSNSIASGITATDTTSWNHKLDSYTETDPVYSNSIASGITATDTTSWNHKLDSYTETDPVYSNSIASGITATDTTSWNHKLDSYTETDPVYSNSIASGITATDTTSWNHKLDSYTETDPVYSNSIASGITATDTISWNHKLSSEVDGDITNELQTLSISNDTIFLSDGGKVKLPASGGLPDQTGMNGKYLKTDGTNASWEEGPVSPSFGYVYQLATIADATVGGGADVPFSNNGPFIGVTHTARQTGITVPSTGLYKIDYSISITAGSGTEVAIAIDGFVDASTSVPCLVATGNVSGTVMVVLGAGNVITLRNNSAIALTMALAPSVGAQLSILKVL